MTYSGLAVVIPVGSPAALFARQVSMVLSQCPCDANLVLSLNSSRRSVVEWFDDTLRDFDDDRIIVVDSSDRAGAGHARNIGSRATNASVLAFCDADDLVVDAWLSELLDGLNEFDAVTGHIEDVYPDPRMANWRPPTTPGTLPTFLGMPYLLSGNLAVRRPAFEAIGGFDEQLTRCEDIAFGWSLQDAGYRIGFVPTASVRYSHRSGIATMLRQHYHYGRGMGEVLRRYGAPSTQNPLDDRRRSLISLVRPNSQQTNRVTVVGTARRFALAVGRIRGLIGR